MKRVVLLPTLITVANGYCGLLAVYKTYDGKFHYAAGLILLAMVFDVLDGMAARMTRVTSRFGAQLDSLSDAISFGVAPAFLAKAVVEQTWPGVYSPKLLAILTAIYALGALLRLARYNVEHASGEGTESSGKGVSRFDGIPTPGAAGVIAALVFLIEDEHPIMNYSFLYYVLPPLCTLLGFLMISRVPYEHFGSRFLQGRRGFRYLFVVVVVIALVTRFPQEVCAVGFAAYGLSGPLLAPFRRGRKREKVEIPDGL